LEIKSFIKKYAISILKNINIGLAIWANAVTIRVIAVKIRAINDTNNAPIKYRK
jgi:hypothetical protein